MRKNFYFKKFCGLILLMIAVQLSYAQNFVHPGILHTEDDFARIRTKIAQNAEPWISAYNVFKADASSNKNYVLRGPADSVQRDVSLGLKNYTLFIRDADAAYNTAVMWKLTGDTAYARKSVQIMNAWSYKLKVIYGSDAQLGAGQIGFRWVNAAEIIRYSYPGWASQDIQQFETMLKTVFVPLINMYGDANWGGGCIKAMMGIGIFCNDSTIYQSALNAFYNDPCTSLSKIISPSGQNSESGRDQIHAQINIGHLAEVAWVGKNQGLDLFGALDNRILTGFEYTAQYMLGYNVTWDATVHRCTMGPWSSITAANRSTAELCPMYEMVYNYYVKHKGLNAPYTAMAAANTRIENKYTLNYDGEHLTGWGTLMFSLDEGTKPNNQTITFPAFPKKRFGDADFDAGATSSSGLGVIYSSANPSVATIVNNKIHLVSAGTVDISAYQPGDNNYNPASKTTRTLSLVFDPYQQFEAEDYNLQANTQTIAINDVIAGNAVAAQNSAAYTVYAGAKLGTKGSTLLYARYASVSDSTINVKFRLDGPTGPTIGQLNLKPTGTQAWATDSCSLTGPVGIHDIYAYFGGRVNINWFKLDSLKTITPIPVPVNRLEAEDYSQMSGFTAGTDGTIGNIKSGQWESYKNINLNGLNKIEVRAASNSSAGSTISKNVEIHLDALTGPVIATIVIPKTGSWSSYTTVNVPVSGLSGIHDLYFKFTATGGTYTSFLFNLDWYQLDYTTQSITFNPLPPKTTADADFSPGASASSGLDVSYSSSNNSVVTIVNQMIHIVGNGTAAITANQAGNAQYTAAAPVTQQLVIKKAQTITFDALSPKTTTDPDFVLGGVASSGLPVTYLSSDTLVARISGQSLHIVGPGQAVITAIQPGDSVYAAAAQRAQPFSVKANQTILAANVGVKIVGDADFDPAYSASSGLAVKYTSSDTTIAAVIQNMIHIKSPGTVTITVNQPGDSLYAAAAPVNFALIIKRSQNIVFDAIPEKLLGDPDFTPVATASSGLPLNFASADTSVAQIVNGKIHLKGVGETTITAVQGGDSLYAAAPAIIQRLQVSPLNLSVQYMNDDNNITDNTIKPEINIINNGSSPVNYTELTVRYWFTAENYTGLNTWVDYAQMGNNHILLAYQSLSQPRSGAFGYVEYSFVNSPGVIAAGSQSGAIKCRFANTDWSVFNEADDYSYQNASVYQPNPHICIYRNGVLVFGVEPPLTDKQVKLSVSVQSINKSGTTNTISNHLRLNNEGNVPLSYGDLAIRYWFTKDGNASLNYWVDYAKIGNSNINGRFIEFTPAVSTADTYLEIKFNNSTDQFYPLSNTGNIQHRITKIDWSNFNQTNDYSYLNAVAFTANPQITVYYKGALIYGAEPAISNNNSQMAENNRLPGVNDLMPNKITTVNTIYPNPVNTSYFFIKTTPDLNGRIIQTKIYDLRNGSVILSKPLQNTSEGILRVDLASTLRNGVYSVRLNELPMMKLIIEGQ